MIWPVRSNHLLLVAALLCAQHGYADAPPAAPSAPSFQLDGNALVLPGPIVFETGSDKLKPESNAPLQHVIAYLDAKSYVSLLRVENHSDNVGDARQSQTLSERRALAITRWLVGKGVDCKRLIAVGFGANKPVADNATADGRALNRRSSFINAMLRGRAIGGMPVDGGGVVSGDPCK